ncbi:glycosyl transferase [Microbacterium sp. P06]|uniref:glycosyl transferase n=1 Tax=Microbacterium sp. P06 TaxID=3366949 RepID=UPI003745FD54
MRFVWAVVAFLIAAVLIGAGIAQRTVFEGPSNETQTIETDGETAFTLVDGAVLTRLPGAQTLTAEGDGTVFAAYGRTADLRAWLADSEFTQISVDGEGAIGNATSTPTPTPTPSPTATADEATGDTAETETTQTETTETVRNPAGSDLWLEEFQAEGSLTMPLQLPDTMSVLLASDGTAPAPSTITLSWPLEVSTPWAGPLIVGGSLVLLVGIILYFFAIRHSRRSRGPRRKGLPMPVTEPIDLAVEGADKGVVTAGGAPTRRAVSSRRRAFVVVPAIAASALLFAGCSADAWPDLAVSPTPTPTETVIVPEGQQAPAVTENQAERIVARVAETVAAADAAGDADLAATRLGGAALAERQTNYTLRAAIPEHPALPAVPAAPIEIVLPQAFDSWPRSVLTVVEDSADTTVAPTIMLLTQEDPWSEYKATYVASLEASTELPEVAASYVGAYQVPPDSGFLALAPEDLAAAYADVINNGENSPYWAQFDTQGDLLLAGIQANKDQRSAELAETGTDTATIAFESVPGTHEPLALATQEGGAIVAVNVNDNDTVKPTNAEAVIKLTGDPGNPAVRALTGVDQSSTGFTTTYSDQLFFYVPPQGSSEQVRLLGYRSSILEAKVIP